MNGLKFGIDGLYYIENFITEEEGKQLIMDIDSFHWLANGEVDRFGNKGISRRTQQYGYSYIYQSWNNGIREAGGIPNEILPVVNRLNDLISRDQNFTGQRSNFNQIIINEYLKYQGICSHIDSLGFGPIVCSLSLLKGCNMTMTLDDPDGPQKKEIWLKPNSLLIMSGSSRYQWKHSISRAVKMRDDSGNIVRRDPDWRRISLTFRSVFSD